MLQGNIVGSSGPAYFVAILAAMALHDFNAKIYQLIPSQTNPQSGEIILLKDTFGSLTASMLLLLSRPVLAICLGTANRLLPAVFTLFSGRPLLALFFLAGSIGILMAIGFAGSDLLDKSIRAGLSFWLLSYAMTQLALFIQWRKKRSPYQRPHPPYGPKRHMVVFLAMLICSLSLVLIDDNIAQLLLTMLVIPVFSLFMACLGLFLAKSSFANRQHK